MRIKIKLVQSILKPIRNAVEKNIKGSWMRMQNFLVEVAVSLVENERSRMQ